MTIITSGKKVTFEYIVTLENKKIEDTDEDKKSIIYNHGSNEIISGLERALEGMKIGENKHVTINPEDGYGPVIEEAIIEISKNKLPPDLCKVGALVRGHGPNDQVVRGQVIEIKDDIVIIDCNHNLAGKTLFYEIKVLDIQ